MCLHCQVYIAVNDGALEMDGQAMRNGNMGFRGNMVAGLKSWVSDSSSFGIIQFSNIWMYQSSKMQ